MSFGLIVTFASLMARKQACFQSISSKHGSGISTISKIFAAPHIFFARIFKPGLGRTRPQH